MLSGKKEKKFRITNSNKVIVFCFLLLIALFLCAIIFNSFSWYHVFEKGTGYQFGKNLFYVSALVELSIFILLLTAYLHELRSGKELLKMAYYDYLTKLPNKQMLLKKLSEIFSDNRAYCKTNAAVMIIDLNVPNAMHFFNGVEKDKIILKTAQKLKKALNPSYTVARMESLEFAVILDPVYSKEMVLSEAEKIIKLFDSFFGVDEHNFFAEVKIGISLYSDGNTNQLLDEAFLAVSYAKNLSGSCYVFYKKHMGDTVIENNQIEKDLHQALINRELELFFQPIYHLKSNLICEAEALLRWNHPQRGNIPPSVFIPLAEKAGLIHVVQNYVVTECVKFVKEMDAMHCSGIKLAVNLTGLRMNHFRNMDLTDSIEPGMNGLIIFCIDEKSVAFNAEEVSGIMESYRKLGVRFELDNFGGENGSVNNLSLLPIDAVKIDKSMVAGIGTNKYIERLIKLLIEFAHATGIQIICSGVENIKQLQFLKKAGCDMVQGFYLCHPIPFSQMCRLFREYKSLPM